MKRKKYIGILLTVILLLSFNSTASAAEKRSPIENRYYLGEAVKTGLDNGYKGEEKIKENDAHFNWTIGKFFVDGFTSVVKEDAESPVFLKNVGDTVTLWFSLEQDIDKLNNNDNLSISKDYNGSDEYFGVPKTDFGRGTLIIRKTDYTNAKEDPIVYTDYLAATASPDANTEVELFEEGDYEVALDYEIKNDPRRIFDVSIIPTYSNYRIFFKFSVRNGNSMVYPFDVKTKSELMNTSVTENGFYLDFANSHYLDINIKKEVLNKGADGLVEDVRFNRPAKDGEEYTEEGIYTITSTNGFTQQVTVKKIYVGKDDLFSAVAANSLTEKDANIIPDDVRGKKDGTIIPAKSTISTEDSISSTDSTPDSVDSGSYTWIIIIGASILIVIILAITLTRKSSKKEY